MIKLILNIKILIKKKLILLVLRLKAFKSYDSVIIFSEPRSGSTWLLEIITKVPGLVANWEPLHVEHGVVPKEFNLGWRPKIDKFNKDVKLIKLFNDILTLQKRNDWTLMNAYLGSIKNILTAKIVVTKFVRANLLIPYLLNNFKFNIKPIFLLRHPVDVCMSQKKNFSPNDKVNININNVDDQHNFEFLNGLKTNLEKAVANWCMSNVELINEISGSDAINIIFYSDLLLDPKEYALKIFKTFPFLKSNDINHIIKNIDFEKKSGSDFNQDYIKNKNLQVSKYIDRLSEEEKQKIQVIFDYFNFKLYDAYSPYPKYKL